MTDINSVNLVGRLTKDIGNDQRDFAYVGQGTARANLSIACNRARKNGNEWVDETSYFDVVVWGKTAENLKQYFVKGQQLIISGYLKQDRWEKDGQKYSRVYVVAENVELGASPRNGGYNQQSAPQNASQNVPQYGSMNYGADNQNYQNNYGGNFPEDVPWN